MPDYQTVTRKPPGLRTPLGREGKGRKGWKAPADPANLSTPGRAAELASLMVVVEHLNLGP